MGWTVGFQCLPTAGEKLLGFIPPSGDATSRLATILELAGWISTDVRRFVGEVTLSWRLSLVTAVPSFFLVLSSRSKGEIFRGSKCHEQLRCESSFATGVVVAWSA